MLLTSVGVNLGILVFFKYFILFAESLLPQFLKKRRFDANRAGDGVKKVPSGPVKKIVGADNLAPSVDVILRYHTSVNSPVLILGTFFFAIQI